LSSEADVKILVDRYLTACESVYPAAISNGDIRLAGLIARSALSTVINASAEIGPMVAYPVAVTWFERLVSLYKDDKEPTDISRSLRWASTAMIGLANESKLTSSDPSEAEISSVGTKAESE
jgi:hypothetical protein